MATDQNHQTRHQHAGKVRCQSPQAMHRPLPKPSAEALRTILGSTEIGIQVPDSEDASHLIEAALTLGYDSDGHLTRWLRQCGRDYLRLVAAVELITTNPAVHPDAITNLLRIARRKTLVAESLLGLAPLAGQLNVDNKTESGRFDVLRHLHYQFLGAIGQLCPYQTLKEFILKVYKPLQIDDSFRPNYLKILKKHLRAGGECEPPGFITERLGDDHAAVYQVSFSDRAGNRVTGSAGTINEANFEAARQYLIRFAPDVLTAQTARLHRALGVRKDMDPVTVRTTTVTQELIALFGLPESAASNIQIAQTSRYDCERLRLPLWRCNNNLSLVGSLFLRATLSDRFLRRHRDGHALLSPGASLVECVAASMEGDSLLRFLHDRGIAIRSSTNSALEVLYALCAALPIHLSGRTTLWDYLPPALTELLESRIAEVSERDNLQPVENVALILLQAIGLGYSCTFTPDGETDGEPTVFRCQLTIANQKCGESLKFNAGETHYPPKYRRAVAGFLIKVIQSLFSDQELAYRLLGEQTGNLLARLLLSSALRAAELGPQRTRQWCSLGILGLAHVKTGDVPRLVRWASRAHSVLAQECTQEEFGKKLKSLYDCVPNAFLELVYRQIGSVASAVVELAESSSPWSSLPKLQESAMFTELKHLLRVLSLSTRPFFVTLLSGEVATVATLCSRNAMQLIYTPGELECSFVSREGAILEFLSTIIMSQYCLSSGGAHCALSRICAVEGEIGLSLTFEKRLDLEAVIREARSLTLTRLLEVELGIRILSLDEALLLYWRTGVVGNTSRLESDLEMIMRNSFRGMSEVERSAFSQLLHDAKNALSAAADLGARSAEDRTIMLQNQLDASRHLDFAGTQCRAAMSLRSAMSEPRFERVSMRQFFRDFVAKMLGTIPDRIRLVPPMNLSDVDVRVCRGFLEAMLINLVKNATEAIVGSGEVHLEWRLDSGQDLLEVSVADSGTGLTEEGMAQLLIIDSVNSNKRNGTGVGLFTVKAMVRRLGGSLHVTKSELGGLAMSVLLPCAEESDVELQDLLEGDIQLADVNRR